MLYVCNTSHYGGRQEDQPRVQGLLERHIKFKVSLSSIIREYLKIKTNLRGGLDRRLRAHTTLVGNPSLVPNIHVMWLITISNTLFQSLEAPEFLVAGDLPGEPHIFVGIPGL